jgi:Pentapeptide repeats (8 copies)
MADASHLARLRQGVTAWNAWRRRYPKLVPDLSRALLVDLDLRGINLAGAHLARTNLRQTTLSRANLTRADLERADLRAASLRRAKLDHANLSGAILRHASLAEVSVEGATLTGCEIYGIAAWNLRGTPKDQSNLVIRATREDPAVAVDDLEVAQFVYLLLHNEKIRSVIDTVGRKAVLILGRFTDERKAVLDALRDALRARGYVPMLFDFDQPSSRDLTETIVALAHMSRFIIADLTDPRSVPQELTAIIPDLPSVPVAPVVLATQKEYGMFEHWKRYPWVLPILRYKSGADLLGRLQKSVIEKAERKAQRRTGVSPAR